MITQVLMQPGSCSIELKADAPLDIRLAPRLRDHIIVTPGRIFDTAITPAVLKAAARHSFRIDQMTNRTEFAGPTIAAWLGDASSPSKGPLLSLGPAAYTLTGLINAFTWNINGLTKGTAYSSPATSITDTLLHSSHTAMLKHWLQFIDGEYRVNASGSLDWGSPGGLWKSGAAVDLLLTRGPGERLPSGQNSITVDRFDVPESGDDWANGHWAVDATPAFVGGTLITEGGFAAGTNAFVSVWDDTVHTAGNAGPRTTEMQAEYVDQKTVSATVSGVFDLCSFFTAGQPGDYVRLYDPERGLVDTANESVHAGQTIHPLTSHRVLEMTTPVQRGMGVYHYATAYTQPSGPAGTEAITDWSDYIEYETSSATLTLGVRPQLSIRKVI